MKSLQKPPAVVLTQREQGLAARIKFEAGRIDHDELRQSCAVAAKLARSLLRRNAIPAIRKRYFEEPAFNPGGRKSRYQVFRDNGCSDDEILEDGNFLRHLRYMIYGPALPAPTIARFLDIVAEDVGSSGMVRDQLRAYARAEIRARRLDRHAAAEAFFMLTLECGEDIGLAESVRSAALSVRG